MLDKQGKQTEQEGNPGKQSFWPTPGPQFPSYSSCVICVSHLTPGSAGYRMLGWTDLVSRVTGDKSDAIF